MPAELHMPLPEFLAEAVGEIRIVGHRISLFDVLWEYNQGLSVEELALRFPTLKRATIHKLIAFYLEEQPEVDEYLAAYQQALGDARAQASAGPSAAELQRRLEQIRRTAHNAAPLSH